MAERLRSTGRKSNSAGCWPAGRAGGCRPGTTSATVSQAMAALAPASTKAARQPACSAKKVAAQEGERARDADAGGMAGHGARHHPGIDLVGQQLEAGHVGAGPAEAGQRAQGHGRPEAVGEQAEQEMAQHRAADAEQIDALGVDAVGQGDEHRHRDHVGGVEDRGDPAGLAVAERPAAHHLGQQRRPEIGADLHHDLRGADDGDQPRRRDARCRDVSRHGPARRAPATGKAPGRRRG